jgi:hypothetical protein
MIKDNFLAIMMHYYVLLCSKMTSFPPSEGVSEMTFGSI